MSAFWDKLKKEEGKGALKKDEKKPKKKSSKKDASGIEAKEKAAYINAIVLRPVISEDAMNHQALGKYVFEVGPRSTKSEIAKAVQLMYGVSVQKVNVINYKPKKTAFKRTVGTQKGFKKAIVSLAKGETIELFGEVK